MLSTIMVRICAYFVAFALGMGIMKYHDTKAEMKKEEKVAVASAQVMQKATDHVTQSDNIQLQVAQSVITQLSKEKADQNVQLLKSQTSLHATSAALAIGLNSLRKLSSGSGNPSSDGKTAADGITTALQRELDAINDGALAIARKGDLANSQYRACYNQYNGAATAVNGDQK